MTLPPILRGVRKWVLGANGYYERRSSSARLRLYVLASLLEARRT